MQTGLEHPITDDHLHVDPVCGLGPVEIGKLFARSGGTHVVVVNKGLGFHNLDGFRESTARFLGWVREINQRTPVRALGVVGPHPAQLVELWNAQGPDRAVSLMREALSHSASIVGEGSAVALGEVGRPHFDISHEILEASNRLLDFSFALAADLGCPVQVHMEASTPAQFRELAERARLAGLPPSKVVRHFSGPVKSETGVVPSIISTRRMVESALRELGPNFMMETDYIDDSSRPGAVLGPRTVPRLTKKLLAEGVMDDGAADRIHRELVEETYGIEVVL